MILQRILIVNYWKMPRLGYLKSTTTNETVLE